MSDTTNKNANNVRAFAACVSDAPLFWSAGPVRNQQTTTVLARRDVVKIAGQNVHTFREEGTQSLTVTTLYKYLCHLSFRGVRLPISGHRIMKVPESDCAYHLYHSGVEDNSRLYGVAIALSPLARAALLAWEPVSHRLAMVRLKGAVINVTVITVYAPTLNAAEKDKNIIYCVLQAVVDRTPSTVLLVVVWDWNARTGPANKDTRHVLGRFGLGTLCDNGDRLVNFAVANRIVVSNTCCTGCGYDHQCLEDQSYAVNG
ncbi:unnamed protein product [Acanthosepion pharaonis]|uniref:Endonuclease/exonuclease/phosphatase domain-containing protein n=1 Tax=Acanthosepion pharaonis TaxID=158019 RepID=A0A812B6F7_ACAPH|nr:unnamed protein product [Sepia pharaonis]